MSSQYPYTGLAQPTRRPRRWPWVVGIVAAFFLGLIFGVMPRAAETPTYSYTYPSGTGSAPQADSYTGPSAAAPSQATGPASSFGDGVYQVGTDIVAGRYKTPGPSSSFCYWERSKTDSGELGAIIANDNISGPGSITVKQGEFVKASGGCAWSKAG